MPLTKLSEYNELQEVASWLFQRITQERANRISNAYHYVGKGPLPCKNCGDVIIKGLKDIKKLVERTDVTALIDDVNVSSEDVTAPVDVTAFEDVTAEAAVTAQEDVTASEVDMTITEEENAAPEKDSQKKKRKKKFDS